MLKVKSFKITPNTVNTGERILIEAEIDIVTWNDIKISFSNWNSVKGLINWSEIYNFIP